MKDPYVIFGLNAEAGEEALTLRYHELRNQYSEDRFLPGNAGNEAAEKLSALEEAWEFIRSDLDKRRASRHFGTDFGHIDNLIRDGRYDEAQSLLDGMSDRSAEWHYLQSIIFYKREWIADSKTQLEMAVNMDPYNTKYRTALDRMRMIDGNPRVNPSSLGNQNAPQQPPPATAGSSCTECCMAYLCADCLCNMGRCC